MFIYSSLKIHARRQHPTFVSELKQFQLFISLGFRRSSAAKKIVGLSGDDQSGR